MSDLLPCPWCRKLPEVGYSGRSCYCATTGCPLRSVAMTVEAWNRRAAAAPPPDRNDLLAVGRAQSQHDAGGSRSSPPAVPPAYNASWEYRKLYDFALDMSEAGVAIAGEILNGLEPPTFNPDALPWPGDCTCTVGNEAGHQAIDPNCPLHGGDCAGCGNDYGAHFAPDGGGCPGFVPNKKRPKSVPPAAPQAAPEQYQCDDYFCRPCTCTPPAAPQPAPAPQPAFVAHCPYVTGQLVPCHGQAAPQTPAEPVAWIDRDDLAALQVQQDNHDSDQLFYPPVSRWKCAPGDVPLCLAPHSAGPAPGSVVGGVVALDDAPATQCPKLGGESYGAALSRAIAEWLASPAGRNVVNPVTLGAPEHQRVYLSNRLQTAFILGADFGREFATNVRPLGTGR